MSDAYSRPKRRKRISIRSWGTFSAALAGLATSGEVHAADKTTTTAETLTVVGSALSQRNNASANPVQTITSRQIQRTASTTIGEYLQRLPSIGSSGTTNTQTSGGLGMSCTDIRNLGASRVLVLIDGKRQVQSASSSQSCVDLNTIPVDLVDSIEILKDGGSELYGADAVSGVINIKLKHNLTTGGFTVRGGITDQGDGQTGKISGHKGFNFDQGRGNITLFGSYETVSPIMQRNRTWARDPQVTNPVSGKPAYGSSISTATRVMDPAGRFNLVQSPNGDFTPFSSADNYNYGRDGNLTNYLQTATLHGQAHYDVTDWFKPYASIFYSHKTTQQTQAPSPVTGSIYPSTLPSSFILPSGNPYNMWGQDVNMYKRMDAFGDRQFGQASDTWQVNAGAKGHIFGGWNYDASMAYGASDMTLRAQNVVNYNHMMQEMGVRQLTPGDAHSAVVYDSSVCAASSGCVLQNPFAPWSQKAVDYASATISNHTSYQLRDFNFRVHNNHLVHMPYAHGGDVGLAFGVEHRSEQLSFTPDPLSNAGDIAAANGSASATGGGFNTTEIYGELNVPFLRNAFMAKDLSVDAQGRWSRYNTFGSTQIWKTGINWAPVDDIRFRATLGTSFRQPNVYELYGGRTLSYQSAHDPCAQVSSYGALSGNVAANCALQGINTASFVDANAGKIPTISGGNPNLQPETGRTWTVGTVITPRFAPHLNVSVEYWHYTINHTISALLPQYVLDECYTGADPSYCSDVSQRTTGNQISTVQTLYQNLGTLREDGLDFDLSYNIHLFGKNYLSLSNNYQQVFGYNQQNEPNGKFYNYTGRMFNQTGSGIPRIRDYATATWSHGNVALTYMMSYTSGMVWNNGTTDLTAKTAGQYRTPGIFAHDLTLTYTLPHWTIEVGVNNLLDKKPPFVLDSYFNTAAALYGEEMMGRYVFVQVGSVF